QNHRERLEGEELVRSISELSGVPPAEIAERLVAVLRSAASRRTPYARFPLMRDVPFPVWGRMKVRLEGAGSAIRGIECVAGSRREYPCGQTAAHVVGYVREMNAAEAASAKRWGIITAVPEREKTRLFDALRQADTAVIRRVKAAAGGLPGDFASADDFIAALVAAFAADRLSAEPNIEIPGEVGDILDVFCKDHILRRLSHGEKIWLERQPYLVDARVGADGVEAFYNGLLSGVHGYRVVERTLWDGRGPAGEWRRYMGVQEPVPGGNLELTLDVEVQKMAERAISGFGRPAAAAAMRIDGGVIALASWPAFDPEQFAAGAADAVGAFLSSPVKPMLSRAHKEHYPFGSVIKVLDALAGLSSQAITPSTHHVCDGAMFFEGREYRCNAVHGDVDLFHALSRSCNVFFYLSALQTGKDVILDTSRAFGLGQSTGIDLPYEIPGEFPSRSDDGVYRLSDADFLYVSIGQGPVAVTPLQAARMTAGIAAGGRLPKPFLAAHKQPEFSMIDGVPADAFDAVRKGMIAVVHLPEGSAYEAFHAGRRGAPAFHDEFPYILVAGKTGTAEHGRKRAGLMLSHSWFAGFAPARAPEIAFAVVIEGGGRGGGAASWAAAQFFGDYFRYTRKGALP
ncbi:MAG TPA: hypothetical protein ENN09_05590, partial [Planctomycetes bacterium]|nr:hypothetical protein [Planctomycetota bacterium]